MKYILYLILVVFCLSCRTKTDQEIYAADGTVADSTQWIISMAIEHHGGQMIDNSHISFDFRGRHYISDRNLGQYAYQRIWQDTTSGDQYRDVLSNEGLFREINGRRVSLSPKDSAAYARSTNSVIYFALLPYFLQDPSVRASYVGQAKIKGQDYYKIRVTFRQEGGGRDFEDVFIYWIQQEHFTMDYLAYNYQTDGGGARFRAAYNEREIEGIRFSDYINYRPEPEIMEVNRFDTLFIEGNMKELSRIVTENIEVSVDH